MRLVKVSEEKVLYGIHGIIEEIYTLKNTHELNGGTTEVHPLSDSVYKDIRVLSESLQLLCSKAESFSDD